MVPLPMIYTIEVSEDGDVTIRKWYKDDFIAALNADPETALDYIDARKLKTSISSDYDDRDPMRWNSVFGKHTLAIEGNIVIPKAVTKMVEWGI